MQYLSPESIKWLEKTGHLEFPQYFVGSASDRKDRKVREAVMEIAVQWCMLYDAGLDGKELNPKLHPLLKLHKSANSDSADPVNELWQYMCGRCAECRFAHIDDFTITRAVYGVYRALLPEEAELEPFDKIILEALMQESGINPETERQFSYGIRNNGLDSEVIMHPPEEAKGWTDYADQFRISLLPRDN